MSARQMSLRIVAATTLSLALLMTVVVLSWPDVVTASPSKTVVVTKTPEGCVQFAKDADAFVEVTSDFLGEQNRAVGALINADSATLDTSVERMKHLQNRYDAVMSRYSESRAGCLT